MGDLEICDAIRSVARDCNVAIDKVYFRFAQDGNEIEFGLASIETHLTFGPILKDGSSVIQAFRANIDSWGTSIQVQRSNTISDSLIIRFPNGFNNENLFRLLNAVKKHFRFFNAVENVEKILGPEVAAFYGKREEGLHRLEQLAAKLVEQAAEARRQLENQFEEKSRRLEAEFDERRSQLEANVNKRHEDIVNREAELAERSQQLDDRSSRHARRQLRQDLKKGIEARNLDFRLTKYTRQIRAPIHVLFITLVTGLGFIAYEAIRVQNLLDGTSLLYLMIKIPLSILAFAAAIIYYIRWNDQWFQKHANEEFRLKRLDLDIDRASWLVEMALEWKDDKGTEIPKDLVDRLSRNLFANRDEVIEEVKHPSQEALSRVLGTLSSLQVQIPGLGEATIGRRGLNALKKAAKEQETGVKGN